MTRSRPISTAGAQLPLSLTGIRTSLVFALLSACAFFFFFWTATELDRASSPSTLPTGMIWLCAAFLLLPFAACFFALSARRSDSIPAGAGVACGFFGALLLVSPYGLSVLSFLVGMSGWGTGHPDPRMMAAGLALIAFLAASLAIVWFGVRIGRVRWGSFGAALGASLLYVIFGLAFMGSAGVTLGQKAQRQKERADMDANMPGILANRNLLALAACLFQNHMRNPQAEFPASLDPHPKDWNCDTRFAADAVPEYTMAYVPQPVSGRIGDFELTAVPKKRGVNNRNPIMIDNRGIVIVYYPWSREDAVAKDMVASGDLMYSQINFLKSNIERYIKDQNDGLAPATLNAAAVGDLAHEKPSIEENGLRLETRDYETRYFASHMGNTTQFALSAQCKAYGSNCLRSYFADYDGNIHGTPEPRPATADDPIAPRCEFSPGGECPDIDWYP